MSHPSLKLTYLPIVGLAGPIRSVLAFEEIPFEDERIDRAEFGKRKSEGVFPFGSVPVLYVDGQQFAQSTAILRYVAKIGKHDLYPSDPLKALKVDEALDLWGDIWAVVYKTFGMPDAEKLKEVREKLVQQDLPPWLEKLDKHFERNGGLAANAKLSIADFRIFLALQNIVSGTLDHVPTNLYEKYGNITKYLENLKKDHKFAAAIAKA
eukprot:TRINITY_DN2488_c0_g1_i1.p1 TRINITY_DN2488_c0_g1~~TRINITY_DN2488_c0_g1_i1.p1  ORF type:complete len:227 (+),score=80.44 TRINITY_DN2488_c0_g1_i1:55-681(+)